MQRGSHSRSNGFTLIELLVVISIIALLISLLLPAIGKAKDSAILSQCLSNQRGVGVGVHTYQTDWSFRPGQGYNEFAYYAIQESFDNSLWRGDYATSVANGFPTSPYGDWLNQPQGNYYVPPFKTSPIFAFSGYSIWAPANNVWDYGAYDPTNGGQPFYTPRSYHVNHGQTIPYVGAEGKLFMCPGNQLSYGPGPAEEAPFYETFTGLSADGVEKQQTDSGLYIGYGRPGHAAASTYMWRGNDFYPHNEIWLSDSGQYDWGGTMGNGHGGVPKYNSVLKPDDTILNGKPMLTCRGRTLHGSAPISKPANGGENGVRWTHNNPKLTNLLYTDGSAKTWNMPRGIIQLRGDSSGSSVRYAQSSWPASPFFQYLPNPWLASDGGFNADDGEQEWGANMLELPIWWRLADRDDRGIIYGNGATEPAGNVP